MNQLLLKDNQELKVPAKKKYKLLSWLLSFYFSYLTIQCLFKVNFSDVWVLVKLIFAENETSDSIPGKIFAFLGNVASSGRVIEVQQHVGNSRAGKFLLDKTKLLGPYFSLDKRKFSLFFSTFFFALWVFVSVIFYCPVSWFVGKLLN